MYYAEPSGPSPTAGEEVSGGTRGEIGIAGGGISACMCGETEGYKPEYSAVCREYIYYKQEETNPQTASLSKKPIIKYCAVLEFLPLQPLQPEHPKKKSEAIQ